jgi:arginase family enzyme
MVLSGLLGVGPLAVTEPLPAARVTVAGVRACDPGEVLFLAARPELARWDVECLRGPGWRLPLEALLDRVRLAGGRLYVSLDLDVFDPLVAPGVAVPEPHGAFPEPVLALLRRVRASGLLAGADVVELYPPADRERQTTRLAARALSALGVATPWGGAADGFPRTGAGTPSRGAA